MKISNFLFFFFGEDICKEKRREGKKEAVEKEEI